MTEKEICAICYEPYETDKVKIVLGCNHSFHFNCLKKWKEEEKDSCPLCRGKMNIELTNRNQNNNNGNHTIIPRRRTIGRTRPIIRTRISGRAKDRERQKKAKRIEMEKRQKANEEKRRNYLRRLVKQWSDILPNFYIVKTQPILNAQV